MVDWCTPFENELRTLDCNIVILEDIKERNYPVTVGKTVQ